MSSFVANLYYCAVCGNTAVSVGELSGAGMTGISRYLASLKDGCGRKLVRCS